MVTYVYMELILFDKVCLFDSTHQQTILYGQYKEKFNKIEIENVEFNVIVCDNRNDFYIRLYGRVSILDTVLIIYSDKVTKLSNICLYFPFENCDLQLNSKSAIISTICKDYSHRIDEWIKYNLHIGFSGIIIFNNDGNKLTKLNEPLSNCVKGFSIELICKKYKGKVYVVDYPYSPFEGEHWNNIQRISLQIGVNAFRNKCRNIALIDADEFIYISQNPCMKIEQFLKNYDTTITMQSNILTNKNEDDLLDNNILRLAKYVGENKYLKTILNTDEIKENEFILTPHNHHSEIILDKTVIIHYHCWMNSRYKYDSSMQMINILSNE